MQTLPALQYLSLDAEKGETFRDGFPVSLASSSSQLSCLEIRGNAARSQLGRVPQQLGLLSALTRLALVESGVSRLPDSISRLAASQELNLTQDRVLSLPTELTACGVLSRLDMGSTAGSPVLSCLHSLRRLSISTTRFMQPSHMYWVHLTALTALHLRCATLAYQEDLPGGPYLQHLESLSLDGCIFLTGVPESLSAATQIRRLSMWSHRLPPAAVSVLSSLPALTSLRLRAVSFVRGRQEYTSTFNRAVAQIRDECISQGRAPPAISLTTPPFTVNGRMWR